MFINDPSLTTITDGIYIYKNFLDSSIVERITAIADKHEDELGVLEGQTEKNPWYKERLSPEIPELFEVWNTISEFLYPTHVMHPMMNLIVMREGSDMFVHEDSPGEGNGDMLTVTDAWSSCCLLDYGVIAYFGEWEGGEVFYPELGLEVSPQAGDLVIHGATSKWRHGVKTVTSGRRYAFSNFSLKPEKNPGSFYNYKTKELDNQIKEGGLGAWQKPLFENEREYMPFGG